MKILGFAGVPAHGAAAGDWQQYLRRLGHTPLSAALPDGSFAASVGGGNHTSTPRTLALVKGQLRWGASAAASAATGAAAQQVLDAYARFGVDFLQHLEGGFALAIVDLERRRVLLALDRMGIERLAWQVSGGLIAFGTSAEELARFPGWTFGLRSQALYDFLLLHMVPAPDTIFAGVRKLRPGTRLIFENGKADVASYWQPAFANNGEPDGFPQWKAELHESLANAVRSCKPDENTGAFLSGGLDSSSVTGMLARVQGDTPTRTFSMGFGVADYDELRYARIASRHFKCKALEYDITPDDVVTAFPLIAQAYDEPFGNSSAVPTYFCALRAREQGVTHLLAGDGGDEIFGGNERYVRHAVFEHYGRIPAPLRRAVIEPVSRLIPAELPFAPLRKIRSYVDQARIPLPERLESWNFIYQTGISTMLEPDFERSIDPRAPFAVMKEVYDSAPTQNTLHRMLFYDWHFTLSDNDLRKVGSMCELAGVQVSYPMLDPQVVDLSLRIPPSSKIEGGELRSFYKRAMTGFLPQEILNKSKHGFGLPFGEWLKTHQPLRELIYSLLSALKQRGIVRSSFVDSLIEQHQQGHASYFGYAIWDLAMLEAWLQGHGA
jgi:asparagine synthase (glutamine-hydrolysing)